MPNLWWQVFSCFALRFHISLSLYAAAKLLLQHSRSMCLSPQLSTHVGRQASSMYSATSCAMVNQSHHAPVCCRSCSYTALARQQLCRCVRTCSTGHRPCPWPTSSTPPRSPPWLATMHGSALFACTPTGTLSACSIGLHLQPGSAHQVG